MTQIERLKLRTGETDEELLADLLETAKTAILNRRFPLCEYPTREVTTTETVVDEITGEETETTITTQETYVEDRYLDLQVRIALDLYNKIGAEGQTTHSENGISRGYESSWISVQLLNEVSPYVGIPK